MNTTTLKPSNTHPADKLKLDIGLPASQEEDPVTWLQVTVNSTPSRQQTVETCFNKYGCLSVTLADGEDTPIFEPLPGETPLWPSLQMTGLFELPAEEKKQHKLKTKIIRNIERELGTGEIVSSILEDQEWVRTCLQDFVPIDVGHGLWIVPSWLETPVETKIALKLDPGLAFGTGTHPTTFLCLAWLAQNADLITSSTKVMDYGCGSGILAIGAALLGAQNIQATDIDGQALLATHLNAEKNDVSSQIHTLKPKALHDNPHNKGYFDILLANILAEPLLELAPKLAELVSPSGAICMSGLLERHAQEIQRTYAPYFEHFEVEILDGWARVTARKKSKCRQLLM